MDDLRESLHNLTHKPTSQITEGEDGWEHDRGYYVNHSRKNISDVNDTVNHLVSNHGYKITGVGKGVHPHVGKHPDIHTISLKNADDHTAHIHFRAGRDHDAFVTTDPGKHKTLQDKLDRLTINNRKTKWNYHDSK